MAYPLKANDQLTAFANKSGIENWDDLITFIRELPYGRNENRSDVSLVLTEKKGTCSSKHALVKRLADLNKIPDISLILGIYKMNEQNTPLIGTVLKQHGIDYIPEAHCYLKIKQNRLDLTSANANFNNIKEEILEEQEITPEQVGTYKVDYHKKFLKKWLKNTKLMYTFDELWKIREKCIDNIANQDGTQI